MTSPLDRVFGIEDKPTFDGLDYTAAGLGLGGLLAHPAADTFKGVYQAGQDLEDIHNRWKSRDINKLSITELAEAYKDYAAGARNLASKKILGVVPLNALTSNILPAINARYAKGSLKDKFKAFLDSRSHYSLFGDPSVSENKLQSHLFEDENLRIDQSPERWTKFTDNLKYPRASAAIKEIFTNQSDSMLEKILKLEKLTNSPDNEISALSSRMLNTFKRTWAPKFIKEYLSSEGSAASRYSNAGKNFAVKGRKLLRRLGSAGILGGLGLGAYSAFTKTSAERNPYMDVAGAGSGLAGLGLTYSALKDLFKRSPLDNSIMLSYGADPSVGSGHKEPAKAIKRILQANDPEMLELAKKYPWLAETRFKDTIIDEHGIMGNATDRPKGMSKNYRLAIDTGMGHGVIGQYLRNKDFPAERYMAYQTDLTPHHTNAKIYRPHSASFKPLYDLDTGDALAPLANIYDALKGVSSREDILSYGKGTETHNLLNMNSRHLGSTFPVAVDPTAIIKLHELNQLSDEQRLAKRNEMLDQLKTLKLEKEYIDRIDSLKNKKHFITIAGAGRGDYTTGRARMLVEELKKKGLLEDTGILVLGGGAGESPLKHVLKDLDNVVMTGRAPKDIFTGLQNLSDVNWGNSGANSTAEAANSRNKQLLPSSWGSSYSGDINEHSGISRAQLQMYEDIKNGKLKHLTPEQQKAIMDWVETAGFTHTRAPLDSWNRGNIQHALESGFLKGDSAEDVVKALLDEKAGQLGIDRAARSFKEYETGVKSLRDVVHGRLTESLLKKRLMRNLPRGLAGLGLLGAGGYMLNRSGQDNSGIVDKIKSVLGM